jgi:serine/threonine protein kinase
MGMGTSEPDLGAAMRRSERGFEDRRRRNCGEPVAANAPARRIRFDEARVLVDPSEAMSADPTTPSQGARVGEQAQGRYRLVRFLGAGGMGEVYEAEHLQVGKRVAVKCLWPAYASQPDQVERFEREARVASLVDSPHVVDVLDAGALEDGSRFFVMELLQGVTLAGELSSLGALPIDRACRIVTQVALGVGAAHAAGITHRDLKPENVFLVRRGGADHVKVLDFGISKFRREDMDVSLTQTGTAIGTPTYMSPEQSEGSRDVDGRTDIWSMGVILYRMIVGALPFAGDSYARLLINVVTAPAPRLRSHRPEASPALEAIVARCLAKAPGDRFATTAELLEALSDPAVLQTFPQAAAAELPRSEEVTRAGKASAPPNDSETRRASPRPPGSVAPGAVARRPVTERPPPVGPMDRTMAAKSARSTGRLPVVPPPADGEMPFDEVILGGPDGRRLPARAFFDLPLSERIRHVIARTVVFLSRGVEVDRGEALAKMRERRAG